MIALIPVKPLQWRHNERDSVSNHQPHDGLFNCLFKRRSKKTSKLRVTGRCAGNSPVTGEFPAQMASNAKNVSIWWRHHECWKTRVESTNAHAQQTKQSVNQVLDLGMCRYIIVRLHKISAKRLFCFGFNSLFELYSKKIRKSQDYVYGMWQYKVLTKEKLFRVKKNTERKNDRQNLGITQKH